MNGGGPETRLSLEPDEPGDEVFVRFARVAARVLDSPGALVTLRDGEHHVCRAAHGLPESWPGAREDPLSYSFCHHTMAMGTPLVVPDARRHPLVRRDPATMRGVIGYLGAPLVTSDRRVIGTLCVLDFQPRTWGRDEVELLTELAAALVGKVELRRALADAEQKARLAEEAREALRASEERFRSAFEAAPIGIGLMTLEGSWIRVNGAMCDLLGYPPAELIDRELRGLTHPHEVTTGRELAERLARRQRHFEFETRYLGREGREVWVFLTASAVCDEAGEPTHYVVQMQDLTARKQEEDRLRTLSLVDELTGLYNRRAFLAMAGEQCKLARRQERGLLLLFADVDHMKWINDTYGHLEGDRAIREAASVLRQTFRESDLIARLGGDEFAILAAHVPDSDPRALLDRLARKVDEVNSNRVTPPYPLSISVGAAVFDPFSGTTVEDLLASADARMYLEKAAREP